MNSQDVKERLKSAPNPIIDNYRKAVDQGKKQIIDNNHVGWRILTMMVYQNRQRFFNSQGHWKPWKDAKLRSNARQYTEKAVSIGLMLTKYWRGQSLNMIQTAMIKPYLKLSKSRFLR